MSAFQVYTDGARRTARDAVSAVEAADAGGGLAWLDVEADDADTLREIASAAGWSALALTSVTRQHMRPALESDDGTPVVTLLSAHYLDDVEEVLVGSVSIVVAGSTVSTVRSPGAWDFGPARDYLDTHPEIASAGPAGVLAAVTTDLLHGYRPVIAGVENDIDEIEEQLFGDHADVTRRIFALSRELIRMLHATEPLAEVIGRIGAGDGPVITGPVAAVLRSLSDEARHVHARIIGFQQTLSDALTAHAALVGERANEQMRELTEFGIRQNDQVKKISSWAAIGFAPSLVAGVYGMNFHSMPELAWPFGYPFALGLMLAVGGGLYLLFRRAGWL